MMPFNRAATLATSRIRLSPHKQQRRLRGPPHTRRAQSIAQGQKFRALPEPYHGRQTFEEGSHGVYIDEFLSALVDYSCPGKIMAAFKHTGKHGVHDTAQHCRPACVSHNDSAERVTEPLQKRSSDYAIAAASCDSATVQPHSLPQSEHPALQHETKRTDVTSQGMLGDFYPTAAKQPLNYGGVKQPTLALINASFCVVVASSATSARAGMRLFSSRPSRTGAVAPGRRVTNHRGDNAADTDFMRQALDLAQTVTADTHGSQPPGRLRTVEQ